MLKTDKQKRFKTSVLALAMAFLPLGAQAAGLGKLTVVSALGQPLRAEIDLTASREEYSSLSARLASADAFKNAGIEYSPILSGIRFTLDKRPNGQPYLQVASDRPLNEPFVDMLVEVNWASGRLVREYTFLLDPPDVFKKPAMPAPAPVAAPVAAPAAPLPVAPVKAVEAAAIAPRPVEPRAAAPVEDKPLKKSTVEELKPVRKAAEKPAEKPAEKAVEKSAEDGATRQVRKGDTLSKIASEVKPEGVNLDQMLVALFRSNKDAFDAGNMNRLRAGKILAIPDKETVIALDQPEARKIVVAQAADFNAYRKKLAAVAAAEPAKEEAPKQVASGKITPRVEDKVPAPAAGKDKLEVSRTEAGKGGKPGARERIAAVEEDLVARDKALKDANSRIASLEKNLSDLKKLAEMKSAAGAKLQDQAKPAPKPEPAPAVKPIPAKPVEAPKPAEAEKPAEPPKADVAAKPDEAAPPAPKPAAKKPAMPPPPPPPPPSFIEESPEIVFGGGGILALLLGYLGYGAWRRKRQAAAEPGDSVMGSELAETSVFGATGGQSVDTGAALPTDFSQESVAGAAGDEGVDPVAEADVYMAYGRDNQAEEILLEALKTDPTRSAIHLKLLEIYAARKSVQPFETVARDLHGLTAGSGADWDKAATLGRSIDPANSLYGGAAAPAAGPDMAAETVIMQAVAAEPTGEETQVMPGALSQMAATAEAEAEAPVEAAAAAQEDVVESLDFDLDLGAEPAPVAAPVVAAAEPAADDVMSLDFDLDLGAPVAEVAAEPVAEAEASGMDFDLGLGVEAPAVEAPAVELPAEPEPAVEAPGMDFDLDLGAAEEAVEAPAIEAPAVEAELVEPPVIEVPAVEFEAPVEVPAVEAEAPGVDFDLELPAIAEAAAEPPAVVAEAPAADAEGGGSGLDFDFNLGEAEAPVLPEAAPAELAMPELDLSAISLELDETPQPAAAPAEAEVAPTAVVVEDNPEVATKLELAQAYEEMGDKEGARELLNEVLNEGSPSQQEAARNKLAQLG